MHRVSPNAHLDLQQSQAEIGSHVHLLVCAAGSTADVPAGLVGIWWPMHGSLLLSTSLASTSAVKVALDRGQVFVSDSQHGHLVQSLGSAAALGIVARQEQFARLSAIQCCESATPGPMMFPAMHDANVLVRRLLAELARSSAEICGTLGVAMQFRLATVINELQRPLEALIARCPGRSLARKRAVFLRLQRVRNFLSFSTEPDLDMRTMALSVNYSVWRFIKVYMTVFGETPYANVSRCRLERAQGLLQQSLRGVAEIAQQAGYGNRATLTRAMKRRCGVSATQLKRRNGDARA